MELNRMIDHTLLRADATPGQVEKLCEEAKRHHFASVCVNPCYVPLARELLEGTDVAVCCVAGFPLGATLTSAKVFEARCAVEAGAQEVDMVINLGFAKAGDWQRVEGDIRAVAQAVQPEATLKVIIETCLLTDGEKVKACLAAKNAGADFVKTSTGFSTGGATAADVRLMRETVGGGMGVKASGGVRTKEDALAMIEAGATRIGTSNGIKIIDNP